MTVTNTSEDGSGIDMSTAKVELMDVAFKRCNGFALLIPLSYSETTVVVVGKL